MFFVYILRSERTGRFYVGQAQDVAERLRRYNVGTQRATKGGMPWRLARKEEFNTRAEACAREREIKGKKSRKWIEWLIDQPPHAG